MIGARSGGGGGGVIGSTLQETDPVPFSCSSYFLSSDHSGNFLLFLPFFFLDATNEAHNYYMVYSQLSAHV